MIMTKSWTMLAAAVGCVLAGAAAAQSWPTKPVRGLVGYNAGTTIELAARLAAGEMSKQIGQPIIIENRPSVGGVVAAIAASKAEPDGYTLLAAAGVNYIMLKDPIVLGKDLSPIGDFAESVTLV